MRSITKLVGGLSIALALAGGSSVHAQDAEAALDVAAEHEAASLAYTAAESLSTSATDARGICTAAKLQQALEQASPGKIVRIGRCAIRGTFKVPAGVTLEGMGPGLSWLAPLAGQAAVYMAPSQSSYTTTLRNLSIKTAGTAGVIASGAGNAAVRNVSIYAARGIAIGAEGLTNLDVYGTYLVGPATVWNQHLFPTMGTALETATHGLVVVNTGNVTVEATKIGGWVNFGALFVNSVASVTNSAFSNNISVNVAAYSGITELSSVVACGALAGAHPQELTDHRAVNLAVMGGAELLATGVGLCDSAGEAAFIDSSFTVEIDGAKITGNEWGGIRAQNSDYLQIDNSSVDQNGGFGVLAVGLDFFSMLGGAVTNTFLSKDQFGDGVQAVETATTLDGVTLGGNERAGMLAALGPNQSTFDLQFYGVNVAGKGYGVIAQQLGFPLPLITDGITRDGATFANDVIFSQGTTGATIAGSINPCFLPAAAHIQNRGLRGLYEAVPSEYEPHEHDVLAGDAKPLDAI